MKKDMSFLFEGGSLSKQKKKKATFRAICVTLILLAATVTFLLGYFAVSAIISGAQSTKENEEQINIGDTTVITLTESDIYKGDLLLLDATHPLQSEVPVTLIAPTRPKNEKTGTPVYSLMGTGTLSLNEQALKQFNLLAEAFFKSSGDDNLLIYNAYDGTKSSQAAIYESGSTLSLGYYSLNSEGEYVRNASIYGVGTYNWVYNNAHKYGFILLSEEAGEDDQGSNVFRYVGIPHATAMHTKRLSLSEYMEKLKETSPEEPMAITANRSSYAIYYLSSTDEHRVPISYEYDISGNNADGYVITVNLSKKLS